jgi:hypothetical protein
MFASISCFKRTLTYYTWVVRLLLRTIKFHVPSPVLTPETQLLAHTIPNAMSYRVNFRTGFMSSATPKRTQPCNRASV